MLSPSPEAGTSLLMDGLLTGTRRFRNDGALSFCIFFHIKEMFSELAIFICVSYFRESNITNKNTYEDITCS